LTKFELVTELPLTPEEAFDRSLDVDVHVNSMAASREVAITGVTSGPMAINDEVTWRAWHFGIPWRMRSRITALERPRRFVDEQVSGPFGQFRHEHLFELSRDGTSMVDRVQFSAPFGWIGVAVERLVLARYLKHLIRQRNAYLAVAR